MDEEVAIDMMAKVHGQETENAYRDGVATSVSIFLEEVTKGAVEAGDVVNVLHGCEDRMAQETVELSSKI